MTKAKCISTLMQLLESRFLRNSKWMFCSRLLGRPSLWNATCTSWWNSALTSNVKRCLHGSRQRDVGNLTQDIPTLEQFRSEEIFDLPYSRRYRRNIKSVLSIRSSKYSPILVRIHSRTGLDYCSRLPIGQGNIKRFEHFRCGNSALQSPHS
jgi:hypothetical protein